MSKDPELEELFTTAGKYSSAEDYLKAVQRKLAERLGERLGNIVSTLEEFGEWSFGESQEEECSKAYVEYDCILNQVQVFATRFFSESPT